MEETPMARTVQLIEGLEKQIKKDGTNEQAEFDAYACWCEKTMERKANDITSAKELITETEILIKKLKGEIASHGAEIDQLKKDIAQNKASIKEAQDLRNKESKEYMDERTESEQCIGAMEAAIKVLTGAGTKKSGFLETLHEAELMSIVVGVKTALKHKVTKSMSDNDVQMMKRFVAKPEAFVGVKSSGMSAAQTGQNPFGDYAPQSTQIQGILKGMYDAFTADLEKDNANEANAQKTFEEIFATKLEEQKTLEETLQIQETNSAAKSKKLAESEVLLDDTNTQLQADEEFFADTKAACQDKATQWSQRTRLRTEELNGMQEAIRILSSESAKKTFESSTTTFLQLATINKHTERSSDRAKSYNQLKVIASRFGSRSVATIAVAIQAGGHFDKVIGMIDEMIVLLRKEEQEDIEHRDRCENSQNANGNEISDLKSSIEKTEQSLKRMENSKKELEGEIDALELEIKSTKKDMAQLLEFRNEEVGDFRQALKDDSDAVDLLGQAIVALTKFYKRNKMATPELVQKAPEYTKDADKAPETSWSDGEYGGRKGESGGIIAILEMLKEDVQKEMAEGRADDADAQEKYLKQNAAMQETLDAQEETKANTEKELADLEEKMSTYEEYKNGKENDKKGEEDTEKALGTDCAWVKTHFESRRNKRKDEIQGLVDAKAFLAGIAAGDDSVLP